MNATWHIRCPACGVETPHRYELHNMVGPEEIWECDEQEGGCGASLVVRPMAALEAKIRVVNSKEFSAVCSFKGVSLTRPTESEVAR